MIIRFPTGLYLNKIPAKPGDSGSITWVISTEEPSRPNTTLQQYPNALQAEAQVPSSLTAQQIRRLYGDLLVTLTKSKTSTNLSNSIRFEVGKIIEQADLNQLAFENTLVPNNIEIQHNNNVYDLKNLGLTDEEILMLEEESAAKSKELQDEITNTTVELDSIRNAIFENQKKINEANNSINALSITNLDNIKEKLEQKLVELQELDVQLRAQESELDSQVLSLRNQLLTISILVR